MDVISFIRQFITLPTLVGIVILSRQLSTFWQTVIGVTLVIFGLVVR